MATCPTCGAKIKPLRGADVDDLFGLLAVVCQAIDRGHADLARAIVHLLIQHKNQLGLRSRTLAKRLAEHLAEQTPEGGR